MEMMAHHRSLNSDLRAASGYSFPAFQRFEKAKSLASMASRVPQQRVIARPASMAGQSPYDGPSLLHIGYIKTATTYLQNRIFSDRSFGMGLAGGEANRSYLIKWLRTDDQYLFDPGKVAAVMSQLEAPLRSEGLVPVWSEETLLGNPITRHYDGAWTLTKLQALNKPLKILITVRRQADLCLSAYREYLKLNRHTLRDFIGTGKEPRSYMPIMSPEYLCFDVAVEKYIDAFGPEKVLVLPQELLRLDPNDFITKLGAFVNILAPPPVPMQEHNVGLGATALNAARYLNAFFVRSPLGNDVSLAERVSRKAQRSINWMVPKRMDDLWEARWRQIIEQRYQGLFSESNARLQAMIDIDLAKFGYDF